MVLPHGSGSVKYTWTRKSPSSNGNRSSNRVPATTLGTTTNTLRHPGTVTRCPPPAPSGVVNQFISASLGRSDAKTIRPLSFIDLSHAVRAPQGGSDLGDRSSRHRHSHAYVNGLSLNCHLRPNECIALVLNSEDTLQRG